VIAKIYSLLKRNNVLATYRPKVDYQSKSIEQDLKRLLLAKYTTTLSSLCNENKKSIDCLNAVILFLKLLSMDSNFNQYSISKYELSQYMKLDTSAYSALNLFPDKTSMNFQQKNDNTCLYNLLNHCQTSQGSRLLSQWIKQPLLNASHINERQSLVEIFVDCPELRRLLINIHLKKLPYLDRLSKKFLKKTANLQDCYKVYVGIKQLRTTCDAISKYSEVIGDRFLLLKEVFLSPVEELLQDFKRYMDMLETTLDFEMIENHEYLVRSDFDPELQRLRSEINQVSKEMDIIFRKAARELDLEYGKAIKLEYLQAHGYVFRVTCKDEKVLRKTKQFTTLDTNKNGVKFRNADLEEKSNTLLEFKESYRSQQNAVVVEIVTIAAGYASPLRSLGELIAQLDVLVSFSQAAASNPQPYVRPRINSSAAAATHQVKLIGSRHPCLELQNGISFIPNDLVLRKDDHSFVIITGPNMGGKSTYIRQAGVIVLMAQIGSFVPCTEAEITLFDAILARVGAGDSQTKGVSTFMAEMLETATIINSATENSLIIMDELGRGTSTYDGFGLAWAISKYISTTLKSACLFATHFHEMTLIASEVECAVNYHVTAISSEEPDKSGSSVTMLYQVLPGSCDKSFGIHVAECVGFPDSIVSSAKRKAQELENYFISSNENKEDGENTQSLLGKKKVKLDGEIIIAKFTDQVRSIDWAKLTDEEKNLKLAQLKKEVLSHNNDYIASLVNV